MSLVRVLPLAPILAFLFIYILFPTKKPILWENGSFTFHFGEVIKSFIFILIVFVFHYSFEPIRILIYAVVFIAVYLITDGIKAFIQGKYHFDGKQLIQFDWAVLSIQLLVACVFTVLLANQQGYTSNAYWGVIQNVSIYGGQLLVVFLLLTSVAKKILHQAFDIYQMSVLSNYNNNHAAYEEAVGCVERIIWFVLILFNQFFVLLGWFVLREVLYYINKGKSNYEWHTLYTLLSLVFCLVVYACVGVLMGSSLLNTMFKFF